MVMVLDLYKALDTITEFHRNEKYFEQEMTEYHKIKGSHSDLKNWIAKNKDLAYDHDHDLRHCCI